MKTDGKTGTHPNIPDLIKCCQGKTWKPPWVMAVGSTMTSVLVATLHLLKTKQNSLGLKYDHE